MVDEEGGARSRRRNDRPLGCIEDGDGVSRHPGGFGRQPGVERRLAAAGLGLGELDLQPSPLQDFDHRLTHFGDQSVDQAGHQELDGRHRKHGTRCGAPSIRIRADREVRGGVASPAPPGPGAPGAPASRNVASSSARASSPAVRSIEPPAPITMPFCESRSTTTSASMTTRLSERLLDAPGDHDQGVGQFLSEPVEELLPDDLRHQDVLRLIGRHLPREEQRALREDG